jgi:hypothetical protein
VKRDYLRNCYRREVPEARPCEDKARDIYSPRNPKEVESHQKLEERQGTDSPSELLEGIKSAISYFQTCGLQNCDRTNSGYF